MTSVDASDKMLKYALKLRWVRRKEPAFDKWGKFWGVITSNYLIALCYVLIMKGIEKRA